VAPALLPALVGVSRQAWVASDSWSPATQARVVNVADKVLVTLGGWWDNQAGTNSASALPSDSGGTFTAAVNPTTTAGQDPVRVQVAYQAAAVATHTVTPPAVGADGDGHLALVELPGVSTASPLRTTGRTRSYHAFVGVGDPNNVESIAVTTSGGTTPSIGDVALLVVVTDNENAATQAWSVPSGWTALDSRPPDDITGFLVAWRVLDVAGHVSATVTWDDPTDSTNVAEMAVAVFAKA
jgi:hypothetical protein